MRSSNPAVEAVALLRAAGASGPTLLVDDLERLTPSELELLPALVAASASEGLASLVLSCAPGPVADALLRDVPGLDRLDLKPLDPAAVAVLVSAALRRPDDDLVRLVEKVRNLDMLPKPEVGIQFGAGNQRDAAAACVS